MARSLSPTKREIVWQRERYAAHVAGRGRFPICIHCDLPVHDKKAWDVAHRHARAFGGIDGVENLGVAHAECNRRDGAQVTSDKARTDRVRQADIGARGPGLGKHPMRGGRRDTVKRTMAGRVVKRATNAQRHTEFIAARCLYAADGTPVGIWAPDPPHAET